MRVVFVSHMVRTGKGKGIYQIQLANIAKGIKNNKHIDSYYVIPEDDIMEFIRQSGINISRVFGIRVQRSLFSYLPINVGILQDYESNLSKVIKDINPEIIISMEDFTYLTLYLCLLKMRMNENVKLVVYHGPYYYITKYTFIQKHYNYFQNVIFPKCIDLFVTRTTFAEKFMRNKYKKIPVIKIPPPIDTSLFRPINEEKKLNKILFIGRLGWDKGYDILLRSIILTIKNKLPVHFKIITFKNKTSRFIQEFIRSNHILKQFINIEFNKHLEELVKEYNTSFITLNTSRFEIFGMTMAESLACGTPVIATTTGGAREIIINNYNGILVNHKPEDIARNILLLYKNMNLYGYLKMNARRSIVQRFSIPVISNKWEKVLHWLYER